MSKLPKKGLSDRELRHLETVASIKGEAKYRSRLILSTVLWNLAPSTYTSIIAFAMYHDGQYGMATVIAVSVALSWALHGLKPSRNADS